MKKLNKSLSFTAQKEISPRRSNSPDDYAEVMTQGKKMNRSSSEHIVPKLAHNFEYTSWTLKITQQDVVGKVKKLIDNKKFYHTSYFHKKVLRI